MAYGYSNYSTGQYGGDSAPTEGGETFFQRQRRLAGEQQAQLSGSAPPTGSQTPTAANGGITSPQNPAVNGTYATPVTGNGKIPEPQPTAAPAPAPAPPPRVNFSWGVNGVGVQGVDYGNTNNWTDADWAAYERRYGLTPSAPAAAAGPAAPLGQTEAARLFSTQAPQLGQLPGAYAGTQFTQYVTPDHDAAQSDELSLVRNLLQSGGSMNDAVTNALKQKSMEEALLYQKQLEDQSDDDLASRGFSLNGGSADAAKRATQEQMMKAIIAGNRDIDVKAASTNRADQLNALNAAEGVLSGQVGRSGDVYRNRLLGETTQANDQRTVSQDAIDRAIRGFAANLESANFKQGQEQSGLDEAFRNRSLDVNERLGQGGLNLDSRRLTEQGRQFDLSNALNILQFLEGQRQSDNSLGFNWANLNSGNQAQTVNTILGMLR